MQIPLFSLSLLLVSLTSTISLAGLGASTASAADAGAATIAGVVGSSASTVQKIRQHMLPRDREQTFQNIERSQVLSTLNALDSTLPQATEMKLCTQDGLKLDAVWAPHIHEQTAPAVVIFHGNGGTLDSMLPFATWYRTRGFSVLMYTIRGYPGSEGSIVQSGEIGFYLDTAAAMDFLLNTIHVPNHRILAHGYSLGGISAAAAAYYYKVPVILDHTLSSAEAVFAVVSNNISAYLPTSFAQGAARGAFPAGQQHATIKYIGTQGRAVVTDGLNIQKRVSQSKAEMLVIYGAEDPLMPPTFARQFFDSKLSFWLQKKMPQKAAEQTRLVQIPGGHWGVFAQHAGATQKVEAYLGSLGFLHRR